MKNLCAFLLSCLVCGLALSCKKDNTATTTNNTTSKVNLLPADSAAGVYYFYVTDTVQGGSYNDSGRYIAFNIDTAYYEKDTLVALNADTLQFVNNPFPFISSQSTKLCRTFVCNGGEFYGVIKFYPQNDSVFFGNILRSQLFAGTETYSGKRIK